MWYITVAFFLTIFSIFEFAKRKVGQNYLFNISWLVLTFMLVFRYGQGTDYYAYYLVYNSIDSTGSFFVNALAHGEIGWFMLNLAANKIGMSFFLFLGIISFIEMLLIRRFILHYSPYKVFSLLLLYPTFYLTACYSTIRQGLVLCIFFGICVDLLVNRKYKYYCSIILGLTLIHTSAIVLMVLPLWLNFKFNRFYIIGSLFFVALLYYIVMRYSLVESYSRNISENISIPSILVRIILFLLIYKLYKLIKVDYKNGLKENFFKIYTLGFLLSIILFQFSTLSQRLTMPMKAVEVVLIPMLVYDNRIAISVIRRKTKAVSAILTFYIVIMIMNVEFIKNIYSYLDQGNYHSWVTPMDYPYSSVFDQNDIRRYISNFDEEQ